MNVNDINFFFTFNWHSINVCLTYYIDVMSYVYDVTYNKSQKKERIQDVNVLCSITVKISGSEKKYILLTVTYAAIV